MFNSGDELVSNSYRIPWLIWIQLLVLFLIVIVLYFFSLDFFSAADFRSSTAVSGSSSAGTVLLSATGSAAVGGVLRDSQVMENQSIKETGSGTSRGSARREDEIEGCSAKDGSSVSTFGSSHHPCHFLGLAKQAFLKCLGLDFSTESSSTDKRKKER